METPEQIQPTESTAPAQSAPDVTPAPQPAAEATTAGGGEAVATPTPTTTGVSRRRKATMPATAERSTKSKEQFTTKKVYLVKPNGRILTSRSGRTLSAMAEEGDVLITKQSDVGQVPTKLLVQLYNKVRPEKPIQKFANRETAAERMYPVIDMLAKEVTREESGAARTKAKTTGGARKAAGSTGGGGAGRPSMFAGKRITRNVKENPRREGTFGHRSFALIKDGMTYEAYLAAGGRRKDLAWDVDHKFVTVHK